MSVVYLIVPVSAIRDNYRRGTVGDFLKDTIREGSRLSVVSAYFTIYAYQKLSTELAGISGLRFLFGETRFIGSLDPDKTDKKSFKIEDEGLRLQNRLEQKAIARDCAAWLSAKAEIRSVKQTNFLHGKLYHLAHADEIRAIMGSSNFTVRGLGLGATGNNIELNLEVSDQRTRLDLATWFDDIWNSGDLVTDVKKDVLLYLEQLYQNHAPEFIYFKTLFHLFEKFLANEDNAGLLAEKSQIVDTEIWKALFEFQQDGVKGAINKILAHNGCILADSVGLGKTYEALAVIKYFELRNHRVLVLCPKKLRENWTIYQVQNNSPLNPFLHDRLSYTVLSHTDLDRESGKSGDIDLAAITWGNYDLIIIDESHNFRNNTAGKRDEDGRVIRKSRYERLMEDILQAGVKTKVLLLSATPVNNNLKDLRNPISLLTEGRDDAFRESIGIPSFKETLRIAQATFTEWAGRSGERKTKDLLDRLRLDFFTLLDELTIARSRKHIKKYYQDSIEKLGGFPVRRKPLSIVSQIDLADRFPSYDTLNREISEYQLSVFNPSRYVLPAYRELYAGRSVANFLQSDRENFLIGMMKVNFLKRLESSVRSFAITMERTVGKIEELEGRIRQFQKYRTQNPDVDLAEVEIDPGDDEELQEALEVGKKFTYRLAHLDVEFWLRDLRRDRERLYALDLAAKDVSVTRDAKLHRLKELIAEKVTRPTTNKLGQPNRKVLVFTAFADTAVYLYDALRDWAVRDLGVNVALVSGGAAENRTTFGKNEFNQILTNFSPVAKSRAKIRSLPQDGEIDLLIATDCISEGQNLQDCDYLVNYDIHWNPVRIIQRFGRIDRIGSINSAVQLVNFWPTDDLDNYIALKARVESRMALVDLAATFEDNPLKFEDNSLQPEAIEELIKDDLKYRDRQLKRMRDEVLDLEDFSDGVDLTEFTLEDFRLELSRYLESNRQLLQDAPFGLYAVVPPDPAVPVVGPGVIFCLRQKGNSSENETVNPLQPYFLVYIRTDGVVRFTFAQPKQVLEMFRLLCVGKIAPNENLCALFDRTTDNGADMRVYDDLLRGSIRSIAATFRKRTIGNLQSSRGAKIPARDRQANEADDFELITWLVIA